MDRPRIHVHSGCRRGGRQPFRRGPACLGVPLATVSRKVSELEARLQARLLNRSARRLSLTDAGRAYVVACKRILEDVEAAERAASGEYSTPKGEIIVTAPVVFGRFHVLPVVTGFLKAYPEIDLKLTLSDGIAHLLEDRIDVAIRIGRLPDSSLVATQVGEVRRVVCASPAYFNRRGRPRRPADLAQHDCITFEGLSSPATWTFRAEKAEISTPIHSRLVVTTAEAAVDAAIAEIGVTRVLSHPSSRSGARRIACDRAPRFRATALAGQLGPRDARSDAVEIAGVPRFCDAASERKNFRPRGHRPVRPWGLTRVTPS